MKTRKSLALAIGLVMFGMLGSATAADFSGTFAGTFQETRIDLNDDGTFAVTDTGRVDGTFGQYTFQEVVRSIR